MFQLQFPREVCNPSRKLVNDLQSYVRYVNLNRSYNNLFTNVYNFDEFNSFHPNYDSAIIDRLFFDFDGDKIEGKAYKDFIKVYNWVKEKRYKRYSYLSGNGYHLYVKTKCKERIKDKKMLIFNAQKFIFEEVNKLHEEEISEDTSTMGKTDQIARIPFTYNFKCSRFCISLFEDLVYEGDAKIKEKARDITYIKELMKRKYNGYGEEILDITNFNTGRNMYIDELYSAPISNHFDNVEISEEIKENPPACVKWLLKQDILGWDMRRIIVVWLRDNAYLPEEVKAILKKRLTKKRKHDKRIITDFEHMEHEKQIKYLFRRDNLFFPTHYKMRVKGLCPFENKSECKRNKLGCCMYGRK